MKNKEAIQTGGTISALVHAVCRTVCFSHYFICCIVHRITYLPDSYEPDQCGASGIHQYDYCLRNDFRY